MSTTTMTAPSPDEIAVEGISTFLRTIFEERDTVIHRLVVTWTENGKKKSKVLYNSTVYHSNHPVVLLTTIRKLLRTAEKHQANVFFGICPRSGRKGRFDLAWQIRKLRVLWVDIDHITVEEALERVKAAGLPEPSIVVNSGNGAHLYWLLEEPYLFDDTGPPIPVETEWVEKPDGGKKPRKYILDNGDRIYLDQQRHVQRLSPKQRHGQNVLGGMAHAVGGDHTTDLSRLFRTPLTLNRKDQRNGKEPKPTELVRCDPSKRYPFALFEQFAKPSAEAQKEDHIAIMPLLPPRKPSAARASKLADLVAASAIAPAGVRSESDFAVCCYAIRSGIAKEEVWAQVEGVGKFAERGRDYFERTWVNAEYDVRAAKYEELATDARATPAAEPAQPPVDDGDSESDEGEPPIVDEDSEDGRDPNTIYFDAATTPVKILMRQVTDRLITAGNYFSRAEQPVSVSGDQITPIFSSAELAGQLNSHVEFYFMGDESGEFKPLPPAYGSTWLNNPVERSKLPQIKLFTKSPTYTPNWELSKSGYDPDTGIYYSGPAIEPRDTTDYLNRLLEDFCFQRPADRTNFIGILLSIVLIAHFIGSRPGLLLSGNQPGIGKTILAQIIAILREGWSVPTLSYNPNDEEFEKSLGATVRNGNQTLIIDNAKPKPGRQQSIDSACLERSITDKVLCYRLLGSSSSIRAENSHQFVITANTPSVSRDLVSRCVVVHLHHEGDPTRRTFGVIDPEAYASDHRAAILGELVGMVERWKRAGMPKAKVLTRFNKQGWGAIVGGILSINGEPDFLLEADEATEELDETRRGFTELVRCMADRCLAEQRKKQFTAGDLTTIATYNRLLLDELGEGTPRSRSTRMGHLCGRYLGELFALSKDVRVTFHKSDGSDGHVYSLKVAQ